MCPASVHQERPRVSVGQLLECYCLRPAPRGPLYKWYLAPGPGLPAAGSDVGRHEDLALSSSLPPPRTATHRTDGAVWMWRAPWRPRQPSSRSERRPLIAAGTPDCCVAAEEDRGSRARRGARRLRLRGVARGVALDVRACGLQGSSCLVPAGLHASDGVCQLVVTGKNLWSSFDPGV